MTKKIEKKSPRAHHGQGLSALWLSFLMFVFGYLAASWLDVNQLVTWVSNHLKTQSVAKKDVSTSEIVEPLTEQHPKLEFYTLSTDDAGLRSSVSEKVSSTTDAVVVDQQSKSALEKPNRALPLVSAQSGPMELALTTPASASTPAPISTSLSPSVADKVKGHYVIQVGSFRSVTEAKRIRDRLETKGYSVNIVPVTQQSTNWYRVMVGPFPSLVQMQQTQSLLSRREHITGMSRKIDG